MLEIILARAASLAAGKGTLVVALAGVDPGVPGEMARGGEDAVADLAFVLLPLGGGGGGVMALVWIVRVLGGMEVGRVRVISGGVRHVVVG